jgi:hypothetical protein
VPENKGLFAFVKAVQSLTASGYFRCFLVQKRTCTLTAGFHEASPAALIGFGVCNVLGRSEAKIGGENNNGIFLEYKHPGLNLGGKMF